MPPKQRALLHGRRRRPKTVLPKEPVGKQQEPPDSPKQDDSPKEEASDEQEKNARRYAEERFRLYARIAWMPAEDIRKILLNCEAMSNGAWEAVDEHASGYRLRQMSLDGPAAVRAREDAALRISGDFERLRREKDVHYMPLSQALKSVKLLCHQTQRQDWNAERRSRSVAGRDFARKLLEVMHAERPDPPFEVNEHVANATCDNTYATASKGLGSQKNRAVERLDTNGDEVEVFRMHYVNSFDLAVDARECQLSPEAVRLILARGPYTQSFERISAPLGPDASKDFMRELLGEAAARCRRGVQKANGESVRCCAEAILQEMLGRDFSIDVGQPAVIVDNPPLFDCNTHS